MLIAVNYHYVRPAFNDPHPGIFGMTVDAFTRQLELLGQAGEFVSTTDIVRAIRGEASLPDSAILITFDDGLREQYEVAWQIMRRMHVPGVIFANTKPIEEGTICTVHKIHLLRSQTAEADLWTLLQATAEDLRIALPLDTDPEHMRQQYPFDSEAGAQLKHLLNFALSLEDRARLVDACFTARFGAEAESAMSRDLYLTRDHIRELAMHGAVGSHSHDHLPLALIGDPAMRASLNRSADLLEQWSGIRPTGVSYPYGTMKAVTPEVADACVRAGYIFGFTVELAANHEARLQSAPLLLARYDCNYMPGGKMERWSPAELFAGVALSNWYAPVPVTSENDYVRTAHNG